MPVGYCEKWCPYTCLVKSYVNFRSWLQIPPPYYVAFPHNKRTVLQVTNTRILRIGQRIGVPVN